MAGSKFKKDMNQNDIIDSAKAFGFSFGLLFLIFILFVVATIFYPPKHDTGEASGGAGGGATAEINAEQLVQKSCIACHGQNLEGMSGPALANIGSKLSADDISKVIKEGRGIMPPGLINNPKEVAAVAKWLSEKK
ncbi:YqzM family protein [Brevibacillus daliensis]|uniref:YqzM family protein n=1 Tax=Brevibacillus daliensis TaxID=2892995 RepID=UPI001E327C8E|nr:YqzM family protein [Brevibacillus daliensis]